MENKTFRCHLSIIFEQTGLIFGGIVIYLFTRIDDVLKEANRIGKIPVYYILGSMGVVLLLFLAVLFFNFLRWRKTYIHLDPQTLVIERNTLINKVKKVYNLAQISNIDMEQTIFERIMGTVRLKLDTDAKGTNDKTDIKIVLKKDAAQEFKHTIMRQITAPGEMMVSFETKSEDYQIVLTDRQIVKHCLFSIPVIFLLIIVAAVILAMVVTGVLHEKLDITALGLEFSGGMVALLLSALSGIYKPVKEYLTYYGFRARRAGNSIYISQGLLKKNLVTLPVDKIHGIILKQSFLGRLFGKYYIEVINMGMGDEKKESASLLLYGSLEELHTQICVLLPEYQDMVSARIIRQNKKIFLHYLTNFICIALTFVVAGLVVTQILPEIPMFTILLVPGVIMFFILLGYVGSYFSNGYHLEQDGICLSEGVFSRNITNIPFVHIQEITYSKNLVSRCTGLCKGHIKVYGTVTKSHFAVPRMKEETYTDLTDRILKAHT